MTSCGSAQHDSTRLGRMPARWRTTALKRPRTEVRAARVMGGRVHGFTGCRNNRARRQPVSAPHIAAFEHIGGQGRADDRSDHGKGRSRRSTPSRRGRRPPRGVTKISMACKPTPPASARRRLRWPPDDDWDGRPDVRCASLSTRSRGKADAGLARHRSTGSALYELTTRRSHPGGRGCPSRL